MAFTSVLIGDESLLVQCAELALARGNGVAAVVTRNPQVADWARCGGLRVEAPGRDLPQRLAGVSFDWLLSIANLSIIADDVLALPAKGAVNFHDGPLPRHAGLNAPVWALIAGEAQHGIAWHLIEGGVDEGDLLVTRAFDITGSDTALTLNAKAYAAAIDSFPALLDQLERGVLHPVPQDLSRRSYHARDDRPAGHGVLDFTRPAAELERLVRALDHGTWRNPLAVPKLWVRGALLAVGRARIVESHAAPGTVLEGSGDTLTVACGAQALVLSGLRRLDGTAVKVANLAVAGDVLTTPDLAALDRIVAQVARFEDHWRRRLARVQPVTLPGLRGGAPQVHARPLAIPADRLAGAVAALAWQMGTGGTLACADAALAGLARSGLVLPWRPVSTAEAGDMDAAGAALTADWTEARGKGAILADLSLRDPALTLAQPDLGLSDNGPIPGCAVTIVAGDRPALQFDTGRIDADRAERLAQRLEAIARHDGATPLTDLPQMGDAEREDVLNRWNATGVEHDRGLTMHRAFEAQVARTPDATALIFERQAVSYADLNARANRAAHLLRQMGVGPGTVVGLCCRRSVEMMVGALAILKAGGAYLPMDPAYPADRLRHFVEDSGASVIVTQSALADSLPPQDAHLLLLDADPRLATMSAENLPDTAGPQDLAYLIYTSGSTGKPKGVMVEHHNVLNFYAGMDAVVPIGGTWLAVTSLSFDISVLELFWTTARGFAVVLTGDADRGLISNGPMLRSGSGMAFSIYYWGNDDGAGRDKYRLLLEGAKFADENGFVAVWTPERHFHAFGGPYPNPSVTGAAVAGVTKNIGVRAGSVVAPLHHPARIAEEWAVIDNLTNGRAGMAIASGWQPDDFILRPENTPPENKAALLRDLGILRKLWRGEPVAFPRKDGTLHEVVTQPRPVSKELPVWVTTAGNPQTWREAGANGCNVLTHLLGQSIDEVGDKIRIYHDALREAGHDPARFTVTLMLHTFLSDTRDHAREIARKPMKDYLNAAAGLIKQYAWAFPAFKRPEGVNNAFDLQLDALEPDELDAILDFAFERYFNDSGLFGTVEDALARAEELRRIGVTEIACLIDYGIDRETVLEGLRPLAQVVKAAMAEPDLAEDDFSIAAQIVRHGVTHLQCTPSMARMIAMNDEARFALGRVQNVYLGGEPLPGALVAEIARLTRAPVTNMYGPTETTIWSSCIRATPGAGIVDIGLPLANQQLYVLDAARHPVPLGAEGELWIGGEGVTRGYWNQPDLTAERFADNPFHPGRMYRTGDLVRRRADGRIDFVGRADHQVKIRGHRIELGEIESAMDAVSGIAQAVVLAREDAPGDLRLVGYYTGAPQDEAAVKAALGAALPAIMVPQHLVHLPAFPLTPNRKVDRQALPAPGAVAPAPRAVPIAPMPATGPVDASVAEAAIAAIWARTLGVAAPSPRDNFFDLGGHSLLAVQAHRAIREELGAQALSITDIFRFPVLADLASRVASIMGAAPPRAPTAPHNPAVARGENRADAMARRREMRARRRA
ncbi:MupA/Atu3671 family FMN-dependent luciferase-like monooxygenase [Thetidibacter halocola]|uniref:LLM class flavin-dependent oxidoreductase n=1 Tax=Thetidibacter halocola TaxID=2827239 RepID=A0A8J8B7C2_9RHOB|nr:MupA/Atu3671 family FMN-dependent luciferase-like monooxygenase [Thetidibacter halocola]MBS0123390.1 LLM class flavin-dependent oxidoreductase [Thetidibacter halocola]